MISEMGHRAPLTGVWRSVAQIRIRAYLALATNCHDFYTSLDPASRRLCNQAFFTKIILTEDRRIDHTFEDVYDTIVQPENRLHVDYWQRTKQLHPSITKETTLPPDGDRVGTSNIWCSVTLFPITDFNRLGRPSKLDAARLNRLWSLWDTI